MGWLKATINSSIGRKTVMSVTGLFQALFVVGHLLGNANTFRGRRAYEAYSAALHSFPLLVHIFEVFLLAVFLTHVSFGLFLFQANLRARPVRNRLSRSGGGRTLGSMTMPYTGLLLLVFIIYHLDRFRFATFTSVSILVRNSLSQPVIGLFFIFSLAVLTVHLSHGLWSLWRSLGASHPKYDASLEYGARAGAIVIGFTFIMIPVLALFWTGFLR